MLAVFQLNKSSVWFILVSEEDLRYLIMVTDSALGRTSFSTDADTLVSARQPSGTRLITAKSITRLMAQPSTPEVLAGPETRFSTQITGATAVLGTMAVVTAVFTGSTARRTLAGTWLSTLMTAHQGSTTVGLARRVEST